MSFWLRCPDISIDYVRLKKAAPAADACLDSMCNARPVLFGSAADEEHTLSGAARVLHVAASIYYAARTGHHAQIVKTAERR